MKENSKSDEVINSNVCFLIALMVFSTGSVSFASAGGVQEAWIARYNPTNNNDDARAIAVDGVGNVYVTGQSRSSGTGELFDYATVKYNAAGQQQWVARYNGPANGFDSPTAIAVDSSGNVYVTGSSPSSASDPFTSDYATIKYNAAGQQQWVARYNGPANDWDFPTAIAVDGSGNVYVTGFSGNSNTSAIDYVTIKYNSAGQQQWIAHYNGPGGPGNDWDAARAIALDSSGNVYVTGESAGTDVIQGFATYDYATIKYNSAGQQQWVARYNGPGNNNDDAQGIAVDGSGNVYVTGDSIGAGTGYDYATIKYNAAGQQQWVARYNGPGNLDDGAHAIAIDSSANVYVTGGSHGLGPDNLDYATIKYNSAGQQQWVARYNGPGSYWDRAGAIALDSSGNVYVTGESAGLDPYNPVYPYYPDYATVKYNSDGQQQWVARYNGPGNSVDRAQALAVDGSGNVYVTGHSLGLGGTDNYDYATIKYVQNPTPAVTLTNLSTRALAQTGDNVTIAGFIITGTDAKSVVIRGIGPTLAQYNVPGVLADPFLSLRDGSGNVLYENNNWKEPWGNYAIQQTQIQNLGLACAGHPCGPPNALESAILQTLPPGKYTAILSGSNGTVGVGLVEVYDVSTGASAELTNVSTRGFVGTGDNMLIAGFISGGVTTVVVRGIGPNLAQYNVHGVLADPFLSLYDSYGNVWGDNNNWKDSQQAEIQNLGLACDGQPCGPPNDLESAILVTVAAGNYTAVVSGVNNTTGVALVEVYALK